MTDMLKTIEPNSQQLNADDLIGGRALTITVSRVSIKVGEPKFLSEIDRRNHERLLSVPNMSHSSLPGDQPVALHYEGDNGKPYKPCKSMRRVVVTVWGPDANLYVGRRMTLYRDDNVLFGGVAVGGIRISHMSGLDKERTIALTASRAVRKPYTVRPLADELSSRIEAGQAAAEAGITALEAFWKGLSAAERKMIGPDRLTILKRRAAMGTAQPPIKWHEGVDISSVSIDEAAAVNSCFPAHNEVPAPGPVPLDDAPLSSSGLAAEHMQQEDAGAASPPEIAPASDDVPFGNTRLDELISDGRAAATNGAKAFKTWHARLNARDAELIQPYADGLKKVAAQADALST